MANTKSAIKEIRVAERRRQRNKPIRTSLKTYVRRAEALIAGGDVDVARENAMKAASALDKAAAKGVVHPNNAARRKSRLMKKLSASTTSAAS